MRHDRRGFTLVELSVVAVLGALVLGSAIQVLIMNQRTYTAQTEAISGQQSNRMALDVLFNELREVSPAGGDILAMSADSIRVRLMRKFGYVCATDMTGQPELTVITWGTGANAFAASDSVFVYADNDEGTRADDAWISARLTSIGASVCPQDGTVAQTLTMNGQGALFAADSVGIGAAVRSYSDFTFGTTTLFGETYLARRDGGGDMVPIAGPIRSTDGLQFVYRDELGNVTATPVDVRQLEVLVRTGGTVLDGRGGMVSDSITAWIYTRN